MFVRTYSELIQIPSFKERFRYLRLRGGVGAETFGFDRHLNQFFYKSDEWKRVRREVIIRDMGCDLAMDGYEIDRHIIVHHMNPIRLEDFKINSQEILNTEFLVCTTHITHNAIHYGDEDLLMTEPIVRTKFDTCPWRQN